MVSDHDETSLSIAAVSAPLVGSQCSNRKGSVANSSTCPRHDEVATWWSTQCRSTWNIGNRCQKVRDIFRRVSQKWLVNQQAQPVLDSLSDWQPVQLSKSWSHMVTRLEIDKGCVPLRAGLTGTVPVWKLEDRPAWRCNSPDATGQVL